MGEDAGELKTGLLSSEELERIRAMREGGPRSTALLIYERDGARVIPLREGRALVVGREAPADVMVRDASLSRQHACVELCEGRVQVEDLQSTNGTWMDGERIERGVLEPGSLLSFGAVSVSVTGDGAGLDGHDRFLRELNGETARARAHDGNVSLLMIRSAQRREAPVARWLDQVRSHLRPFDRVALYSADTLEVLIPDDVGLSERADRMARGLHQLHIGIGSFPTDAGSTGELLEVTCAALQLADDDQPIRSAQVGEPVGTAATAAGDTVVHAPAMHRVFQMAGKLATTLIPVLIQGDTGTGKEVVARAIHEGGSRAKAPMICVNCGSIPSQLVESTLFGHEKGAFTGADVRNVGVFESADGGTVLLDEVGELPPPAQAALLRVLESRRFCRVGSSTEVEVDVRVLAATHRDLDTMCEQGDFRQDLLFRLNAMTLTIPPLRDRLVEIEPLARHFAARAAQSNQCAVVDIDRDALEAMVRYEWPGNVRELRNAMERAVVLAVDPIITVQDLPTAVRGMAMGPDAPPSGDTPPDGAAEINLRAEVARFEANLILRALRETDWDRNAAAASLGLPLRTLSHKMNAHGLVKGSG